MARIHLGPIARALVVENPHATLDKHLEALGVVVHRKAGAAPDEDELIALLQETRAQVIFKRSRVPVTRRVIESCPELLAVQLCCIGDDSVDKSACADHGVVVFNDPVSNGRSVVELVVGHLVALSRRLYETNGSCRTGAWEKNNIERYEVQGKVLGVLGLGNIGRAVARTCEALGMEIRFFDTREVSCELGRELGWAMASSVEDLFRGSDAVTVHVSARDIAGNSNGGLLRGDVLQQLGRDRPEHSPRIFLNLSRGFLHGADELVAAVRSGSIKRAAVDVYPAEPRGRDAAWTNPYADEPRIAVTPHIGASTQEAQPRIAARVAHTFGRFSERGSIRDCVFRPRMTLGFDEAPTGTAALLMVAHATTRGTKRAIDEIIYDAGASNLSSVHRAFDSLGVAYDLAALDRALSPAQIDALAAAATRITGDDNAIRSVRQVVLD
ncbi:MAG: NAD(P)-dependent oxidoreductase [Myxococcota bacterium]|nr:NAD(P)-dependent oxidoreductase [Myxococcota bacterium]